MKTNETYVNYEQAQALKRLGFDWECNNYYCKEGDRPTFIYPPKNFNSECDFMCSAPAAQIAATWLREVKGWHVQPMLNGVRTMYFVRVYELVANGRVLEHERQYENYEDALSSGLDEILKVLQEK